MVLTPSTMLDLGVKMPDFRLMDVCSGDWVASADFEGKRAVLVMFISRHCPYVKHIVDELGRLGHDYAETALGVVAISSNDVINYPDDSPDNLAQMAQQNGFSFPVCYDEEQSVARAFRAACTPDFFLFGPDRKLVYRGQLDESRPGNGKPVTGQDLRRALGAVLEGREIPADQRPSLGCNIKWKPGQEPDYFRTA